MLEAEYQPLPSNTVSQFDDLPDWDFPATNIRKAEVAFANEHFGKLWLGQGSMASDGSAEVDNSGTVDNLVFQRLRHCRRLLLPV